MPRIFRRIRPAFAYERSPEVLTKARAAGLAWGNPGGGLEALADLREAACEIVTISQYARPSPRHHPVARWVEPEEFARRIGVASVMSGPLVRSSYRAGRGGACRAGLRRTSC